MRGVLVLRQVRSSGSNVPMAEHTTISSDESDTPARQQLQRAFNHFDEVVHRIPDGAWDTATPCEGWSVRDLLAHMTSEHLWAPRLLAGETISQVGSDYDGDVLGEDPVAAWDSAASGSRQAWADADEDTPVHLSSGDTTAGEYAEQMLLDLTVHAWDLASAVGLDPAEGAVAEAVMHVQAYVRSSGMAGRSPFGPEVQTSSDNPLDQLVAMLGRRPANQ